jgi:hypothetical protein
MTKVAIIALTLTCALHAADEAMPSLREYEPLKIAKTIRNPYDRAIKVEKIDSTCSCTNLYLHDYFLLPNAATTVDVEVDNNNRSGAQRINVSFYLSDTEFEQIELELLWKVIPSVTIDVIPPGTESLERPSDERYRDIYSYVIPPVRPDELHRLRKLIRLGSQPDDVPDGGLQLTAIEYTGDVWKLTQSTQGNGSILILAEARDPAQVASEGMRDETIALVTNHPRKPRISLRFVTVISKDAGKVVHDPGTLLPGP